MNQADSLQNTNDDFGGLCFVLFNSPLMRNEFWQETGIRPNRVPSHVWSLLGWDGGDVTLQYGAERLGTG